MELIFNRFRPNSVSGRLVKVLSTGKPMSAAQLARSAKSRSAENILAPGGWYFRLRAYGKRSRKFRLERTNEGKIVMRVSRRAA